MLSALLALGLLAAHGANAQLLASNVTEWFWGSSVVVNNELYITGGEFYETGDDGTNLVFYLNGTLVIDLTSSWTNNTIQAASLVDSPTGLINVRQPMLFYDEQRNKVSRYGGWPYEETDFPSLLWSFTAGGGDGVWKNETSPSTDGLGAASVGPFASAHAYTDTKYYNYGGNVIPADLGLPNMDVLFGMATRDLVQQDWTNSTAAIPNQSSYRTQARMVYAPNFGKQGFLVMVGGESPPSTVSTYEGGTHMVDMATITLYDINQDKWFTQTATGDIPPPRSEFCSVGAASSDNSTFDVFVYGGSTNNTYDLNNADNEGYLNVYALSLPAFRWFKSNDSTTTRRACHTCSVIGNRQMISIGGRLPSTLQALGAEQDPWASGIGVFDMTAFEWADHYDSAAEAYESPQKIRKYYSQNYQKPDFSADTLATVFAFTPPANSSSGNSSGSGSSGGSNTNGNTTSKSHTGAIVGGVVGGVAVLAAIALGIWFCIHRSRKRRHTRTDGETNSANELYPKEQPQQPQHEAASSPMYEVDANSRSEMDGVGSLSPTKKQFVAELPADNYRVAPSRRR